jgi:hypothetical protein
VGLHLPHLEVGEPAGLHEHLVRHGDLADVVQEACQVDFVQDLARQPEVSPQSHRITGHALRMILRVGVPRLQGPGQRRDGPDQVVPLAPLLGIELELEFVHEAGHRSEKPVDLGGLHAVRAGRIVLLRAVGERGVIPLDPTEPAGHQAPHQPVGPGGGQDRGAVDEKSRHEEVLAGEERIENEQERRDDGADGEGKGQQSQEEPPGGGDAAGPGARQGGTVGRVVHEVAEIDVGIGKRRHDRDLPEARQERLQIDDSFGTGTRHGHPPSNAGTPRAGGQEVAPLSTGPTGRMRQNDGRGAC